MNEIPSELQPLVPEATQGFFRFESVDNGNIHISRI